MGKLKSSTYKLLVVRLTILASKMKDGKNYRANGTFFNKMVVLGWIENAKHESDLFIWSGLMETANEIWKKVNKKNG